MIKKIYRSAIQVRPTIWGDKFDAFLISFKYSSYFNWSKPECCLQYILYTMFPIALADTRICIVKNLDSSHTEFIVHLRNKITLTANLYFFKYDLEGNLAKEIIQCVPNLNCYLNSFELQHQLFTDVINSLTSHWL